MIKIDFALGISLILTSIILLVISIWIFYNKSDESQTNNKAPIQQCPVCTHVFYDYCPANLQICPKCKSYITLSENRRKDTES